MAFTEKNVRHNGRTIVWVRKNGVSILACEKLNKQYQSNEGWENEWQRPGTVYAGQDYTACSITGEIIVAKRIKSRVTPGEKFYEAMWEYEKQIERLMDFSRSVYGSCDADSPMWRHIEEVLYEQAALAVKLRFTPDNYVAIFHNPVNRVAHGLRPLEG